MNKSTKRYLLAAGLVLAATIPGAVLWLVAGQTAVGLMAFAAAGFAASQLGQAAAEGVDD